MSDTEESTALEIEQDEENIEKIHERRSLLSEGRKKVKSPSCRTMIGKVFCICFAGVLFILMMIELWADYGTVVATRTLFPPKIYSVTEVCPEGVNGTLSKQYNPLTCDFIVNSNTSIDCTGNMPTYPLALPYARDTPDKMTVEGSSVHMGWTNKQIIECVRLIVWSI
tara:strand:- start:1445 stop:1948 length:504 start_codon:yes stop_codon:yes gene_type:complete